jgi:predicted CXXCH cytochrome family protein
VRRWTLLVAGASLWLFLAAVPALADGGPHVASVNNGSSSLTADSCAGCHRVHTAQGPMLLKTANEETLCLSCHGAASTGATTDVETGIQYVPAADGIRTGTQLGALRGGGFEEARIGTGNVYRITTNAGKLRAKVPALAAPVAVTSAHMPALAGLTQPGIAWGNGANGSGAGPKVSISCGSCHNPHGNGQYRILNTIPTASATAPATFTPVAAPGVTVTDAALPPAGDARNYTIIQLPAPNFLLLASQVVTGGYSPTAGDYLHHGVPWTTEANGDGPNGLPGGTTDAFNSQIERWCLSCHARYQSTGGFRGDPVFMQQHKTDGKETCTTCHVAHGTNASMNPDPITGTAFSQSFTYPDDPGSPPAAITSASSRLLKIDRRGTCQVCHDPTGTIGPNSSSGPTPIPYTP